MVNKIVGSVLLLVLIFVLVTIYVCIKINRGE